MVRAAPELKALNEEIISCGKCPRLRAHAAAVAQTKRRAYLDWEYWGRPVPAFGDPQARGLALGLAPGAHGSNRTGRPFTGDASGNFMYPVLYETGFANQPSATDRNDGLILKDLYITAAVRCAPPDNKPTPQELANCSNFLDREIRGFEKIKVVIALGKIGFDAYLNHVRGLPHPPARNAEEPAPSLLKERGTRFMRKDYPFKHGASYRLPNGKMLLASYHPSNQNTQTGKLSRVMFVEIFKQARLLADEYD